MKLYLIKEYGMDQDYKIIINVLKHFPMTNNVREIATSFFAINNAAILTLLVIGKCFNTLPTHFMILIRTLNDMLLI